MQKRFNLNPFGFIGVIFTLLGSIFFILGIVLFFSTNTFMDRAVEVDAVISDITTYHRDHKQYHDVYVDYEFEGEEYTGIELGTYTTGMHIGQDIEILCDPDNPYKVMTSGAPVFVLLCFSGIGGIFLIIGLAFLISVIKKSKLKKRLLESGMRIKGTITDISRDQSIRINNRHPFRIYCEYHDVNKNLLYKFKSSILTFDPTYSYQVGDPIDIYVDPNNWKKNYVNAVDRFADRTVDFT